MCGIFCEVLSENEDTNEALWLKLRSSIAKRGPDFISKQLHELRVDQTGNVIQYGSSVLWLQGDRLQEQPLIGVGSALLWNGDVFSGPQVAQGNEADSKVVFNHLEELEDVNVPKALAEVQGPFAFVYIRLKSKKLWFGRDFFGRQSLLMAKRPHFFLASVGLCDLECVEVPAAGVFELSLESMELTLHPWQDVDISIEALREIIDCSYGSDSLPIPVKLPQIELTPMGQTSFLSDLVPSLSSTLTQAVRLRATKQPMLCKRCVKERLARQHSNLPRCDHAKVAVLFSGGLDSTVLVALLDSVLDKSEPIDLLNVAFESKEVGFEVPDRLTAKQALIELQDQSPERQFNLIKIDVTKDELIEARQRWIRDLLHPLTTVLDDSIGCALWFAANATHGARVILLGTGADEQLGGYSRHRIRFQKEGVQGLSEELRLELLRISQRNMGRDNRILSHHGVAPR